MKTQNESDPYGGKVVDDLGGVMRGQETQAPRGRRALTARVSPMIKLWKITPNSRIAVPKI